MAYTPSTTFSFSPGTYSPGTTFVFAPEAGGPVQGVLSGVLDDVTGVMIGLAFVRSGYFDAKLDDVAGVMVGNVVPQGVFSGVLDDVTGVMIGRNVAVAGRFEAVLEDVVGHLHGNYDANVPRFTVANIRSSRQDAGAACRAAHMPIDQTTRIDHGARLMHARAAPSNQSPRLIYGQTTKQHIQRCGTVAEAIPMQAGIQTVQDLLQWAAKHWRIDAKEAEPIATGTAAVVQQMTKVRRPDWRHPLQDSGTTRRDFIKTIAGEPEEPWRYTPSTAFTLSANPDYTPTHVFYWPNVVSRIYLAMRHVVGIDGLTFVAPRQQAGQNKTKRCIPVDQAGRPPPGKSIIPDLERPPYEPPPGHQTHVIPTQVVYTMQHIISVKTVSGNVEVPMANVNLSYDADSFAWQFGGTLLDPDALAIVQDVDGVELAVTIDGYLWHVIVENIEHGIQFAKHTITLKGRSLTAELGAPYKLPSSATMGSDLTVQQIADALMPIGWTIDWQAPTWLVPGGAFSYTNQTPIQALATLANDIGCVAVPHPSQRIITIQPRYPVYPWQFGSAPADIEIPESALKSVNLRPAVAEQANGVYVHGGEIGGVLAWCRLNGSVGAKLAPTISNSLMTDVIGCRLLGERILAGQWTQPMIKSAALPLDGNTFPALSVGSLVQIMLDAEPIKGIVNSISIDASLSSVSQTIQIGEQTANAWTSFTNLLPRDPLLVGTISSTDGTTSVVTLLDGGVVSVRGTDTVGNQVYIRAGRIEGPAPAMVQNEIVI